jgi:hypothetical protein
MFLVAQPRAIIPDACLCLAVSETGLVLPFFATRRSTTGVKGDIELSPRDLEGWQCRKCLMLKFHLSTGSPVVQCPALLTEPLKIIVSTRNAKSDAAVFTKFREPNN